MGEVSVSERKRGSAVNAETYSQVSLHGAQDDRRHELVDGGQQLQVDLLRLVAR